MSKTEIILSIATVLGGISALVYFIEKWRIRAQIKQEVLTQRKSLSEIPSLFKDAVGLEEEIVGLFFAVAHQWHNAGKIVCDEKSSNGKAWLSDFSNRGGHVVYGPYTLLKQAGMYKGWFRIRFCADEKEPMAEVVRLEVIHGGMHDTLLLRVAENNDGLYHFYAIPFSYKTAERVELRVEKLCKAQIWVDFTGISVSR
ncbi:hypothetical protein KJ586_00815 [Patescibacteria group bacterium]|nr:hypothetical protein [Patescibacteria group bacterium]MBU4347501.1 hypothetical protein [Patescibacteria group bacterium]MBU4455037.1 hypothetical protein [Patescibacteria group bacterium]MCG2690784.1 hypothetical protein [Candidatus Parcubacteria bacterium]